jgi:hypothetical protein
MSDIELDRKMSTSILVTILGTIYLNYSFEKLSKNQFCESVKSNNSSKLWLNVLETLPIGIGLCTSNGKQVFHNPKFQEFKDLTLYKEEQSFEEHQSDL